MAHLYIQRPETVKQRRIMWRNAFMVFSIAWAIGSVWFAVIDSPLFVIREVRVRGASLIPEESIRDAANRELAGSWYRLFPKDHYLFAPLSLIQRSLLDRFPEMAASQVTRVFPPRIIIDVRERQYAGIWCQGSSMDCYMADAEGVLYREAASASGSLIMIIRGTPHSQIRLGAVAVPPAHMKALAHVRTFLKERAQVSIRYFTYDDARKDVEAVSTDGWYIAFDIDQRPEDIASAANQVLHAENMDRARLQYIDVRIDGRAYYKQMDETEKSHSASL